MARHLRKLFLVELEEHPGFYGIGALLGAVGNIYANRRSKYGSPVIDGFTGGAMGVVLSRFPLVGLGTLGTVLHKSGAPRAGDWEYFVQNRSLPPRDMMTLGFGGTMMCLFIIPVIEKRHSRNIFMTCSMIFPLLLARGVIMLYEPPKDN